MTTEGDRINGAMRWEADLTERGAFLEGYEDPKIRQFGWSSLLDALGGNQRGGRVFLG